MSHVDAFATVKLAPGAQLPKYQSDAASGLDLHAHIAAWLPLPAGCGLLVPTGVFLALPTGLEGQVRPRSGLSAKGVVATLGTIDGDYRGEIKVMLRNLGAENHIVRPGDRIAQLVIAPVVRCHLQVVDALDATARGDRGFGSTGRGTERPRSPCGCLNGCKAAECTNL